MLRMNTDSTDELIKEKYQRARREIAEFIFLVNEIFSRFHIFRLECQKLNSSTHVV